VREIIEKEKKRILTMFQEDLKHFEKKPKEWYPVYEYSPIFTVPEQLSQPWVLALCDASQMFWQGSAKGQSLPWVYKLAEQRLQLFARLGLVPPDIEETRMTADLFREKN
jgi:hypothetical protein